MVWFLKNRAYLSTCRNGVSHAVQGWLSPHLKTGSIGVDIGDDNLYLAQLTNTEKGVCLLAGRNESRPEGIEAGSVAWQKWAVEAIRQATADHRFYGKSVIAAVPAGEVFVEHVTMEPALLEKLQNRNQRARTNNDDKMSETVFSKIKQKLPFEPDDAMLQYVTIGQDSVLVMATERKIINRHLAIYEKAGLTVKSMGAWPVALTNCYARFFGRRKADLQAVVMLLDIGTSYMNLAICRHNRLLFACSILMGVKQLDDEKAVTRLVFELNTCRSRFASMHPGAQIERLIFLCGPAVDTGICKTIARQMNIQAQIGDCLAAVKISDPYRSEIDRRNCNASWATAFGLSLSIG